MSSCGYFGCPGWGVQFEVIAFAYHGGSVLFLGGLRGGLLLLHDTLVDAELIPPATHGDT